MTRDLPASTAIPVRKDPTFPTGPGNRAELWGDVVIKVDIEHLGHPELDLIDQLIAETKAAEIPAFASYKVDLDEIREAAERIKDAKNVVLIGHGGSITTFKGLLGSAGRKLHGERNFFLIDTVDPVHVGMVKAHCGVDDTHVIAVSKSGNTLTVLEVLPAFEGYPTTVVTQTGYGTIRKIAKTKGWNIVDVPDDVGGRFSGGTASALLPAMVLGIDVEGFVQGMQEAYKAAREGSDIINLAGAFYLIERLGKRTIFLPVYSKGFAAFNDLVTQLFHETLSKGRKGLTLLAYEGPECQHHTNQRVLDGPEDVATLFILVDGEEGEDISWPDISTEYKGIPMSEMGPYSFRKAMMSEARGVMGSMDEIEAPWASITMKDESERSIGFYVGMMQYLAFYFAVMRRVEPFDQPAVEKAKEIALEYRKK
jgi:glucose-6-phosphate isomerase